MVCGAAFIRKSSRQVTCLKPECIRAWKDGTSLKKEKKQYNCLRCGKLSPRQVCSVCRKKGESIQVWDTWQGVDHVGEGD